MPMSNNTFPLGTVPPAPPPPFGYMPQPPGPPSGNGRRRWPILFAAGIIGAVIASAAAAGITLQARDTTAATPELPAPVTVTVAAPTPAAPAPLPTSQADRQTCRQGWINAGNLIKSAQAAVTVLPPDVKVGDPATASNPEWAEAVKLAANYYRQASSALESNIAPGTTPVLAEAAQTSVKALRLLGDAIRTSDPITGNAVTIANETTQQTGALCVRLAP